MINPAKIALLCLPRTGSQLISNRIERYQRNTLGYNSLPDSEFYSYLSGDNLIDEVQLKDNVITLTGKIKSGCYINESNERIKMIEQLDYTPFVRLLVPHTSPDIIQYYYDAGYSFISTNRDPFDTMLSNFLAYETDIYHTKDPAYRNTVVETPVTREFIKSWIERKNEFTETFNKYKPLLLNYEEFINKPSIIHDKCNIPNTPTDRDVTLQTYTSNKLNFIPNSIEALSLWDEEKHKILCK